MPVIYPNRLFAEVGGLINYGANFADGYRQAGNYAGWILKGDQPTDLPAVQPTKFDLVINRTEQTKNDVCNSVASLIGRLGSSAFRLSTTVVSKSLAGSCFSSESAPRPFHHGIRRRGGTIY